MYPETHQSTTVFQWRTPLKQPLFLPTTKAEMQALGWNQLDILLISGDAYVDHPTFAVALLGRWLVAHGYRTGIIAQPRWDTPDDIMRMGRPALFAGISAGAIDSMLAHYTAFRKKRHDDAYTPGGKAGARPNRALIVYTNLVRQAFRGLPVILGGIEASLRRTTHYDFWTDSIRRSILLDSKADMLMYGMGEYAIRDIAAKLDAAREARGEAATLLDAVTSVVGTAYLQSATAPLAYYTNNRPADTKVFELPSHEAIIENNTLLMDATLMQEQHIHKATAWATQQVGNRLLVITPPAPPMTTEDLDALYALPFTRKAHPSYKLPIPAEEMIRTSITTHRGCGGGCSFCSLALHQGRRIASRSRESIMREAEQLASTSRRGVSISDVGGPSANMWQAHCRYDPSACRRSSCMFPTICKGFVVNQRDAVTLLRDIQECDGVRHVRVASGVRFDLALKDEEALRAYTMEFTGGQLKVAPEHICDSVLELMRKPSLEVFEEFLDAFTMFSDEAEKEQYVIPYLISAFPGCTDSNMRELANWLQRRGWSPQQVQCFIPTPGTVATAMFATGTAPDGSPIFVARTDAARLKQHAILMPNRERHPAERRTKSQPQQRGQQPCNGRERTSCYATKHDGAKRDGAKQNRPACSWEKQQQSKTERSQKPSRSRRTEESKQGNTGHHRRSR